MNSKRITAAVFAFAAAFSCIGAFNGTGVAMANAAEDFSWEIKEPETLTEGDFTYVQSGRFWNVQKYSGSDKNVVIPERVNGVTVQGIEAKAFSGNKTIESVEIPAGLYSVNGFDGCTSLKEIKFHDYETEKLMIVGENAFKDCVSLRTVAVPYSVTHVDGFRGCTNLKAINIPEGVQTIGDFSGCTSLESIKIPSTVKTITTPFTDCPKLLNVTWVGLVDNLKMFPAYQNMVVEQRKADNKCQYCGGDFKIIGKTCKLCGKKKDY